MGVRCAADIIHSSQRSVVLTGAGVSTPSGIPDFRSTDTGIWEKYDPFEVASLSAFRYNPLRFYEWMRTLASGIQEASPNPAHYGLAKLEEEGYIQPVITQNIDRLHQRAGSKNVLKSTARWARFPARGYCGQLQGTWRRICKRRNTLLPGLPQRSLPDLVLMGEQLPAKTWLKAQEA
jgi:NAD-dependent deacetylase